MILMSINEGDLMDIVHIAVGDYPRYESLLLQREQLKKEAQLYRRAYTREFGELINLLFEKKICCIELKKSIAFCQIAKNHGEIPNVSEMHKYVEKQMTAYKEQLEEMLKEYNDSKLDVFINPEDIKEIKSLYRKIARHLHPDISPLTQQHPELMELWMRASSAYKCNDLKMLQETDFLVQQVLNQYGNQSIEIVIPDIQSKILELEKEIHTIVSTEPYSYKTLLEDEKATKAKKQELENELIQYKIYEEQLHKHLEILMQ